jgi:dTDP-4-dehydrorhamnose reductase
VKALIIGAKGQLGTTLTQTVPPGIDSRAVDLPELDITRHEAVLRIIADVQPDVVINASAYTAVDRAETEAEAALAVNAVGPRNLARAAKAGGVRLIHISTDFVFDGTAGTPYAPEAPCHPVSVYGRTKHQGEVNIASVMDDWVILRTSWLYSRFGNNFVLSMLRLMRQRDRLGIVADQVGTPTWAGTLARAIWRVAVTGHIKGLYHWSDAGVASWYDFSVAIQEEGRARGLLDGAIPIDPIRTADYPLPAKRPAYSVLDCSRSWRDFKIEPLHWRVALRRMLDGLNDPC